MIFGPLFRYELLRLARRGTHYKLKVVLAVALLIGLLASYLDSFPESDLGALLFGGTAAADASRLSSFGESFLLAFLVVQQVTVLLITPVFAGGAITDEKEKGGLDFLLTTPLGRWELVVGKLAARLTLVLAVLATGLPVLFLTLLFGGVSFERVLAGFAISAVTVLVVGTFAGLLGIVRHTLRDVLLWCYGTIAILGLFGFCFGSCVPVIGRITPVSVLWELIRTWMSDPIVDPTWTIVGVYSTLYLALAGLFLAVSLIKIRSTAKRPLTPSAELFATPPAEEPDVPVAVEPATEPPLPEWYQIPQRPVFSEDERWAAASVSRGFAVPRLRPDEDPFVWKERYFAGRLPLLEAKWVTSIVGCGVTAFLFVLCAGLFIGATIQLSEREWIGDTVNVVAKVYLVAATLAVPILGVRASVSVSEERAKQTLLSLLTLPVPRRDILWAKVQAALLRTKWMFVSVGVVLAVAVFTGGIHPVGVIAAASLFLGYSAFVVAVGLWLSLRCANSVRAALIFLAIVLGTMIVPVVVAPILDTAFELFSLPRGYVEQFSPPAEMWEATGPPLLSRRTTTTPVSLLRPLAASVVGMVYFVTAVGFWTATVRRFEREGRS